MVHLLLTVLFTLSPIQSVAEDIVETGQYGSLITALLKNGVDCEIEKFTLKNKAKENLVFSVECTKQFLFK